MKIALSLATLAIHLVIPTIRPSCSLAQSPLPASETTDTPANDQTRTDALPIKVEVAPGTKDSDIAARLKRILNATGWFDSADVQVQEGVVFLDGKTSGKDAKEWAYQLAKRTEDVVAVVNRLEIEHPPFWTIAPAVEGLRELWHESISLLPFILFGLAILALSCGAAVLASYLTRLALAGYIASNLLRTVFARGVGILVVVLGIYIVLRVSGLTRLAVTVLGGTGLVGLVIGIAFRDITENFLAGVFLSIRRPFLVGDLVEIVNVLGFVQRLTTRATVIMTLSGNQVEIPNSSVYKNSIWNFSTNRNRREDFTIGIGYRDSIPDAQEIALKVLKEHRAVLKDPEPWVLVDNLGPATVNLRVYFWLDGSQHSWLKVRSSVIRLVKRTFLDAGISLPDSAREVVFPEGIPLKMLKQGSDPDKPTPQKGPEADREEVASAAEANLQSEAAAIKRQAKHAIGSSAGENLLTSESISKSSATD